MATKYASSGFGVRGSLNKPATGQGDGVSGLSRVFAAGEGYPQFKRAPDERGSDVNLDDVSRVCGTDSQIPPGGDSSRFFKNSAFFRRIHCMSKKAGGSLMTVAGMPERGPASPSPAPDPMQPAALPAPVPVPAQTPAPTPMSPMAPAMQQTWAPSPPPPVSPQHSVQQQDPLGRIKPGEDKMGELLSPLAHGFVSRMRDLGASARQVVGAAKVASEQLPELADELQCVQKHADEITDFMGNSKGRKSQPVGAMELIRRSKQKKLEKQALGGYVGGALESVKDVGKYAPQVGRWAKRLVSPVAKTISKAAPEAELLSGALSPAERALAGGGQKLIGGPVGSHVTTDYVRSAMPAAGRGIEQTGQNLLSGPTAAASVAAPGRLSKMWNMISGAGSDVYNSGFGHGVRGGAVGNALGYGADQMAGLAGYDDTHFQRYGTAAGMAARYRMPGEDISMLRQAAGKFGGPKLQSAAKGLESIARFPGQMAEANMAKLPRWRQALEGHAFGEAPAGAGKLNRWGRGAANTVGGFAGDMTGMRQGDNGQLARYVHGGLIGGGLGAETVHNMAKARGAEEGHRVVNEGVSTATGGMYKTPEEFAASPYGQAMKGYHENGIMGGISSAWNSLPSDAKWQLGLGATGILGGAGLAAAGHPMAGAALGTAGAGLGAYGAGAFGNGMSGSAERMARNQPWMRPMLDNEEFRRMPMNHQSDMLNQMQAQRSNQLQAASG